MKTKEKVYTMSVYENAERFLVIGDVNGNVIYKTLISKSPITKTQFNMVSYDTGGKSWY